MPLTVTGLSRFRSSAGVYVTFSQRTLADLAGTGNAQDMAMTSGRYTVRPPGGRRREPTLRITLTLRMPVWRNLRSATEPEKEEWRRFYNALMEHEIGHYQRFADAAQEIWEAIREMPADQIQGEVDRRWNAMMNDQRSYDSSTAHGTRQNTSFGNTTITPP